MKHLVFIVGLTMIYSCQRIQDNSKIGTSGLISDTIAITYKRYYSDESSETFEYKLIREQKGDSLLNIRYYRDTVFSEQYSFSIRNSQFQLIQDTIDFDYLIPVDTFLIDLLGEQITIYKFEKFQPQMDGEVGYLFNKKYGLLGYSAYSWSSKTILENLGDIKIGTELSAMLLSDTLRYLRRQKIEGPQLLQQFKIIEEPKEIELEVEI